MTQFRFVRNVNGTVPGYEGNRVATGDVVELSAHFAVKAERNPDYERVDREQPRTRSKKKVSRRKGSGRGQDEG